MLTELEKEIIELASEMVQDSPSDSGGYSCHAISAAAEFTTKKPADYSLHNLTVRYADFFYRNALADWDVHTKNERLMLLATFYVLEGEV